MNIKTCCGCPDGQEIIYCSCECHKKTSIKILRSERVTPTESHFEIEINGKTVQFAKWVDMDFCTDYEFINGEEELTEDEYEIVVDFIEKQML